MDCATRKRFVVGSDVMAEKQEEKLDVLVAADIIQNDDLQQQLLPVVDPLNWFGIIVPNSLRQSQTCFKQCLSKIIQTANTLQEIKRKLNEIEAREIEV